MTGLRAGDDGFVAAVATLAGGFGATARITRSYQGRIRDRKALLWSSDGKRRVLRGLGRAIRAATRSIVFCADKRGAEETSAFLNEEGVDLAAYHSGLSAAARTDLLERLQSGELKALAAVNALDERVDVPDLDVGVITSTSARRRQMIQRMGRIARRKDDGRGAAFVVLYAQDTIEDPKNGRPDGYIDIQRAHTEACPDFDGEGELKELDGFVSRAIRAPAARRLP